MVEKLSSLHAKHGEWVFVAPISGVILTGAVNYELNVSQVLFIDGRKLPRVRRRLGIPHRISEIRQSSPFTKRFFDSSDTFAVVRHLGTPHQLKNKCVRIIRDELSILTLSQLGYSKRRFNSHPTIRGESTGGVIDRLFLDSQGSNVLLMSHKQLGNLLPLVLNERWRLFQRSNFFYKLLRVLNGDIRVQRAWREDLRRAAILVGHSQSSDDIAQSFLWNIIALEVLLTQRDGKILDVLPRQAEAFLGWIGFWEMEGYEEKIREAYRKRCDFMHRGKRNHITVQDLLFTDDLLLNILTNLIEHIKHFHSKKDVFLFSKQVRAEKVLGAKPRVRPKTLVFISRTYTEEDCEEI